MNLKECMREIEAAVSYADSTNEVTAYNWNEVLKEKTVVAFGLGKFFRDTYQRLYQMVDISYVCDNNSEKWGKDFYGKKCISPMELSSLKDVFVICVMGDCRAVMKQLSEMGKGGGYLASRSQRCTFRTMKKAGTVAG